MPFPLTIPFSFGTTLDSNSNPPLSQGGVNDDEEALLRKHLPTSMVGKGWSALIAGLAVGDRYRNQQALFAFDQLFKTSANGIYLDRRASNDGFTRPPDIGMGDDVFRKLAIKATVRKQVIQVMLESLEAYYGSDATRAHTATTTVEPWSMNDGDTLLIQIDNGAVVTIPFEDDDFVLPGTAKAIEVAAAITRELDRVGVSGYAIPFTDPSTAKSVVKIYSGALGLGGSVRIWGGRAQNALLFPTADHDLTGGSQPTTAFTIVAGTGLNGVAAGRARFTFTGGTAPQLTRIRVGDYVNMYGSVFSPEFRNTYSVTAVDPTYFEIASSLLTWPGSVTALAANDIRFFRPTRSTLLTQSSYALATLGDPSALNIILPVTATVNRTKFTGAYLHDGVAINISSGARNSLGTLTITTATNHGLAASDWVYVDGLFPTINGLAGLGWVTADATNNALPYEDSASIKFPDGRVFQVGGNAAGPVAQALTRIFTPSTNTWVAGGSMTNARAGHTLTMLKSGRILCVGGCADKTAELYDIEEDVWTDTGDTVGTHSYHTATLLSDGKVLVVGGGSSAELYNPVTGTWSTLTNQPAVSRTNHTATLLHDNRVLIAGGNAGINTAEVYNHVTGVWATTGNMTVARKLHAAILTNVGTTGKVLVVGGHDAGATFLSSAEMFNPATMTFSAIGQMSTARQQPGIATRSDGKILVAGGQVDGVPTLSNTADLYDPVRNKWTAVSDTFTGPRANPNAIDLADGRVLLVGGVGVQAVALKYTGAPVNSGNLNGLFKVVSIPTSTSFTVVTPNTAVVATCGAVGTVTPTKAVIDSTPGPFIFDPTGESPAVTAVQTTLTQQLVVNANYNVITVADASQFPDQSGWLAFAFGTSTQLTPVRYLGRISNTALLLDPSYIFSETLDVGASVILLSGRGAFEPATPEAVGSFYVTAAAAGRVAASNTIDDLVAAGVRVEKTVVYPSDVGLGNAGQPISGVIKISDKLLVWGSDDIDSDVAAARAGE